MLQMFIGKEIDADIKKYQPDSPLIGHGNDFVAAQAQYGVNALSFSGTCYFRIRIW